MRQRIKIMRKFLVCMVTLLAMSMASVYADDGRYTRTAMLEQGDSIQLFYGQDAFQQAYKAAADSGAVITLSKGEFLSDNFHLAKSIKIIGHYGFSSDPTKATVFAYPVGVGANNITLDGIYFKKGLQVYNVKDFTAVHAWIERFYGSYLYHSNTTIDQCVVKSFNEFIISGENLKITNSTLSETGDYDYQDRNTNAAYIKNCVLYVSDERYLCYAMYENNIFIGWAQYYLQYPSIYIHNHFYCAQGSNYLYWGENNRHEGNVAYTHRDVLPTNTYPAYPINAPLGSDGTPVGPLGGSGFTDRPSIPRVTSQSIGLKPDAEGKLNVKITVSAE